jgi:hypothetical protein
LSQTGGEDLGRQPVGTLQRWVDNITMKLKRIVTGMWTGYEMGPRISFGYSS